MNNPLTTVSGAREAEIFNERQIKLIRDTVARDCNDDEFRLFVHTAKHLNLDPLRKQIYATIFNKTRSNRSMSIVVGIDGARKIAAKSGDYRPDQDEPLFVYDEKLKSKTNPLGIEKVVVNVYKFAHGAWHPIPGWAYWEEFAPISFPDRCFEYYDTGEKYGDSGKPVKKRRLRENVTEDDKVLDTSGKWSQMPRLMIAKCAEMQALRRGWPDDLSNVYEQSEVDRHVIDIDPVEVLQEAQKANRLQKIGGPSILMCFEVGSPLVGVPVGQLADRALAHIRTIEASAELNWFRETNAEAFRHLWAHDKTAGLDLNRAIEERIESLIKREREEADR